MNILTILLALLIFGVLILIHELGHFLVARAFGVKILEFSIGMGPKILHHTSRKSGTVYSIRLFPIGGFVSMFGEDGMDVVQGAQPKEAKEETERQTAENSSSVEPSLTPELSKEAYCNKSVWQRILISLAGPMMNILLGFLLMLIVVLSAGSQAVGTTKVAAFYLTYTKEESYYGIQNGDYLYGIVDAEDRIEYVRSMEQVKQAASADADGKLDFKVMRLNEAGSEIEYVILRDIPLSEETVEDFFTVSLSASSGLQIGDEIRKVNQTGVHTYQELGYEIANQGYKPLRLTVIRNGEKIILENVVFPTYVEKGVIFGEQDFIVYQEEHYTVITVLRQTWFRSLSAVKMVYDSLFGLASGRYGLQAVSGPVGITKTISDVARTGNGLNVLSLVIIISINLGVVNLLPLPALDGGHIFLYLIEAITRKRVPRNVEATINFVGLILILLLAILIAVKDLITL